jgi:hypothetical protein
MGFVDGYNEEGGAPDKGDQPGLPRFWTEHLYIWGMCTHCVHYMHRIYLCRISVYRKV